MLNVIVVSVSSADQLGDDRIQIARGIGCDECICSCTLCGLHFCAYGCFMLTESRQIRKTGFPNGTEWILFSHTIHSCQSQSHMFTFKTMPRWVRQLLTHHLNHSLQRCGFALAEGTISFMSRRWSITCFIPSETSLETGKRLPTQNRCCCDNNTFVQPYSHSSSLPEIINWEINVNYRYEWHPSIYVCD